ncbi:hypothetical protein SNEBB_009265 [Seison nebaliae]|nr:hypothetical protein SNEBB_009265 [Seison nebaliae]
MFIYLSKQVAMPSNQVVTKISWNHMHGYVAAGTDNGVVKIIKLIHQLVSDDIRERGVAANLKISMNETLEGHKGRIIDLSWNEMLVNLSSVDPSGEIVVWSLENGAWYQSMTNNRGKSTVTGIKWSSDGQYMAIIYEDGAVIIGTADGDRLWGRTIVEEKLTAVEWSPSSEILLFGTGEGNVYAYKSDGVFMQQLPINCLDDKMTKLDVVALKWYDGRRGFVSAEAPTLAIAFPNGRLQLMRHAYDEKPVMIDAHSSIQSMEWNNTGSILAIGGVLSTSDEYTDGARNIVQFFSPFGQNVSIFKFDGKLLTSLAWDYDDTRIAIAIDNLIFFANVRTEQKCGMFDDTLVYVFLQQNSAINYVMFYDLDTGLQHLKMYKHIKFLAFTTDACAIFSESESSESKDEVDSKYIIRICNSLGIPMEFFHTNQEAIFMNLTKRHCIICDNSKITIWTRKSMKNLSIFDRAQLRKSSKPFELHIDDHQPGNKKDIEDPITALTASEKYIIIGRQSGFIQMYSVPQFLLIEKRNIECERPKIFRMNCDDSRLAVIDSDGLLRVKSIDRAHAHDKMTAIEHRLSSDCIWSEDDPNELAIMEKENLIIINRGEAEEPIRCSGYLQSFKDLEVTTIYMDELLKKPEEPLPDYVVRFRAAILDECFAKANDLNEMYEFVKDAKHPILWKVLGREAFIKENFPLAETAFIKAKDNFSLQIVKKVSAYPNETIRGAERAAYMGRYDISYQLYKDIDRQDLAWAFSRKIGDWQKLYDSLKKSKEQIVDDGMMEEASNRLGDHYFEQGQWKAAEKYYLKAHNQSKIADCYYNMEDYHGLELMLNSVTDDYDLLQKLAEMYESVGMCQRAVEALLRCSKHKEAIECCIRLSQFDLGVTLAQKYEMSASIDVILDRTGNKLLEQNNIFQAVELYRKSKQYVKAAKLLLDRANDESKKRHNPPILLKKMYILIGILLEQNRTHRRENHSNKRANAFNNIVNENEQNTVAVVEFGWKGAEAWHYYLLAQKQLKEGNTKIAMLTSLILSNYENIFDVKMIYSLITLCAISAHHFRIASNAFIRLETDESIGEDDRHQFEQLAFHIFSDHPPKDPKEPIITCPYCQKTMKDWADTCANCSRKFRYSVASGQIMADDQESWKCRRCLHYALKKEIHGRRACPFCHSATK